MSRFFCSMPKLRSRVESCSRYCARYVSIAVWREKMVVTVATFTESGAQLEEGVRHVQEEVVPAIRGAKGLVAGYWLVDRERGQRLSIMAWESAEAMSAAMRRSWRA